MSWLGLFKTAAADVPTPAAGKLRLFFDALGVASVKDEAGAVTALGAARLPGYIDGLRMEWVSGTQIRVSTGSAYIPSIARIAELAAAVTLSPTLAANTWYHLYLTITGTSVGVEAVTTAPAAPYFGTARTKTGDTSRRYIGSFLTDASAQIHQFLVSGLNVVYPKAGTGALPFRVLSNKTTAAEDVVSVSGIIPMTSSGVFARFFFNRTVGDNSMIFGPTTGLPKLNNITSPGAVVFTIPVTSSLVIYIQLQSTITDGNGGAYIDVNGYTYDR